MRVLGPLLSATLLLGGPASAGAGDPPDPGSTQGFTYGSGPLSNPYLVYTPASYDSRRPAPLVVMAHGCQTTAEEQMRANLYNPIAEREGFVVLYPDIDVTATFQPGPTVRCWRFFNPRDWHRGQGDAAALAGMTRQVISRWSIDSERVYMMGMSAGSFMTSIMAAAYPDLYAAVGIMAGGAYGDPGCLLNPVTPKLLSASTSADLAHREMGSRARVVPIVELHGDADGAVPVECGAKALEQGLRTDNLAADGVQDAPIALTPASVRNGRQPGGYGYRVETYLDPGGCVVGERWVIHDMDHFWSGGSSDPAWARWTDPRGPSAAEASWRFFSRYRKSETDLPCAEADRRPGAAPPIDRSPARACPARRIAIPLRLRRGERLRSLRVFVDGRRGRATLSGGRVAVVLRGPVRRAVVVVRARTRHGRRLTLERRYRRCAEA